MERFFLHPRPPGGTTDRTHTNLQSPVIAQDKKQHWFAGVHGDIGGGYGPDEGELWRCAFQWMLNEAEGAHLRVDHQRRSEVLACAPEAPWAEPKHESLTPAWWIAEFAPKTQGAGKYPFRLNRFRPRFIVEGSLIDRTALLRVRAGSYEPQNFSPKYLEMIRGLAQGNGA